MKEITIENQTIVVTVQNGTDSFEISASNFVTEVEVLVASGLPGPQGPAGPAGADGAAGPAGADGSDGAAATISVGTVTTVAAGSPATVTNSGTTAAAVLDFDIPQGAAGAAGAQGPQGDPGADGADGAAGPPGADGSDGAAATVAVGTTTTGAAGTNASVANSGTSAAAVLDFTIPRGDTGATGATGPAGNDGAQGPQGLPGNDGADGAQGPQGLPGNDGATGATGPAGADGAAATVSVGTTTTGAEGTNASVANSGTSSAAVLDFTIPRGDTGATGATGPAGADGAQGPQGLPGADGADGATGATGATGPAGADGQGVPVGGTAGQVLEKIDGTDYNTQWADPSGGGVDTAAVQAIAAGSTLGLQQLLLAQAGQPGLTVLAVGYTTSGKVQGVSLGPGNVVEVYANGADFNAGTVLYREFMSFGETICFTGLSNGAIITASAGFYGFSECVDGGDESPMPLLSYGLSFNFTFFFGFRNCNVYNPGGTGGNQGWVHIVNGPLDNTVRLAFGTGVTVQGQENISLTPWEYRRLYTDGNTEYIIEATNPVMACHNANMDLQPEGRFYDSRLIMPLTNDGITWPRSGFISAPFNNTQVDFWVRDGAEGRINSTAGTGVSPGSPVDFDAAIGVGTGASDTDYEPNGATRVKAIGLVSAYSGADSAGLEASPLMPTSAMSQIVAQPLTIADTGDGGDSGVAIASPYEGTAEIFSWNSGTGQLDLAYTVPLTRSGVTVVTQDDQNHPAAGLVANEASAVTLVGQLNPGLVIADVPITVVVQNGTPSLVPSIRSQNGTTTTGIVTQDDETLSLGITPNSIAVEIREDANGVLRKRVIDSAGVETWVVA